MKNKFAVIMVAMCLVFPSFAGGEGLLPSLTETIGIAMPSIGDTLHRYPDKETIDEDGNTVETFQNVTEEDFNDFSQYLVKIGAELQDYQVVGTSFEATISVNGSSVLFRYDQKSKEATVIFPKGTYDDRLNNAKERLRTLTSLVQAGDFENAERELENIEDAPMYLPLFGFLKSQGIATIDDFHYEVVYRKADSLKNNGKVKQAYLLYLSIRDYKDVSEIIENDPKVNAFLKQLKRYDVGSILYFGNYRDEKIEWIVIAEDGNNRLLLSSKAIDAMKFGNGPYKNSDVRKYLINTIFTEAFSSEEKALIVTDISTGDPIFILSADEVGDYHVRKYLCSHTPYASQRGIRMGRRYCWWGLRDILKNNNWGYCCEDIIYTYVDSKGQGGTGPYGERLGIRPAIWINALDMLDD